MNFDIQYFQNLIRQSGPLIGYLVIWGIVFAESGLLIGFFLPGDSLLFTAGFLASVDDLKINIFTLIFGCFVAAVLGDNVGYASGNRFGRKLFQKEDSWLFHKKHLVKTQEFFEKHGKKALVIARFTPLVRTFAPIIAGISSMHYRTFMLHNLIGGLLWTLGMTLLGYFLGQIIPSDTIDNYLLPIIASVIVLFFIPSIIHLIQENRKK